MASGKRKPGRPKDGQKPITPEVSQVIADLYSEGCTPIQIAELVEVHPTTIRQHLNEYWRPLWRRRDSEHMPPTLACVNHIYRVAWQKFRESAEKPETIEQIHKELVDNNIDLAVARKVITRRSRTGEVAWMQVMRWCLEMKAKLLGEFAPERHQLDLETGLRVAGMSPSEVDAKMIDRLLERVAERKRMDALMEGPPES